MQHLFLSLTASIFFCSSGAIKRERNPSPLLFQTLFPSLYLQPSPPLSLNVYYHGPKVAQLR